MLVLSRRMGERIYIGDNVCVTVVKIGPNEVRIGIEAPSEAVVMRKELLDGSSANESTTADHDRG